MYDVIIIGMGPSGMSASIYAKRANKKVLLLDENTPGGLLNKISNINNYLGFKNVSGPDLALSMFEHVINEKIEYKIEKVLKIEKANDLFKITTSKKEYVSKGIILAIGRKPKHSEIKNEEKYISKGISYCAICDAPLYKNKNIAVLGNNETAIEETLYLKKFTNNITLIVKDELKASNELLEKLKEENIKLINKEVISFIGNDYLTGIELSNNEIINCDGVFIYYGYHSDTAFINNLNIVNDKGYIDVDKNMKTKENMIYACGDIIKKDVYQVSTAVSEGAIAAISICKEIK